MTENTGIRIELANNPRFEDSQCLEDMRSDLQKELEIDVERESDKPDGDKLNGGLTTAIAIASLSLSIFNAVLATIEFYKRPIGKIIVTEENGVSWERDYYNDEDREKFLDDIRSKRLMSIILTVDN